MALTGHRLILIVTVVVMFKQFQILKEELDRILINMLSLFLISSMFSMTWRLQRSTTVDYNRLLNVLAMLSLTAGRGVSLFHIFGPTTVSEPSVSLRNNESVSVG